jgi:hypothetical protein
VFSLFFSDLLKSKKKKSQDSRMIIRRAVGIPAACRIDICVCVATHGALSLYSLLSDDRIKFVWVCPGNFISEGKDRKKKVGEWDIFPKERQTRCSDPINQLFHSLLNSRLEYVVLYLSAYIHTHGLLSVRVYRRRT